MSATADVEALVDFFDDAGESEKVSSASNGDVTMTEDQALSRVSKCFVEGRQFPVKTVHLPSPTQDWVEAALKLIFQIHYKEPLPGDILVFLTGQDTIEGLEKLVNDYAEGMDTEVPKVSS
jgi:ATP-dependent RNA helicase DHR2